MKLSSLHICMCLSLVVHGAVFGVVYVAKHSDTNATTPPVLVGVEAIEIVAEPEADPVSQSHVVVKKTVEPLPVSATPKPTVANLDLKPLVETGDVVPPNRKNDLATMEELQSPKVPGANERKSFSVSISTKTTDAPKAVVRGVGFLSNPKPEYPREARRRRQEGVVLLALTVTQAGRATNVSVVQSSGHDLLDAAALEAVKLWRFTPACVGHMTITSKVEIPIRFKLSNEQ